MDRDSLEKQGRGIFDRAKAILLKPVETWPLIAGEPGDVMKVFLGYAVPLAAIGPLAQFIGSQLFGYGMMGFSYKPSFMSSLSTLVSSYVLSLVGLFIVAWVANFLSPKFGGKSDWTAAFKLVAYSMTAAWVAGIFGLVPALSILTIIGLYSFYLYYKGATPMMQVPENQAVVYTVVTVVVAIVINIVMGLIVAAITGPALMASGSMSSISANGDDGVIDLGDYGQINVDGDGGTQSIDMGEMGRIEVDEDSGTARITVDGREMEITIPDEARE